MAGEHFPSGWNDKQVSIDFIGGTSSLTGKVVDSTATGCVIELVPEGKPRESRARRIFFPWTAIRSIELLEELHERRRPPAVPLPFELPEYPVT
ncbi:MAG TPA: hypothetical protein VKA82_10775 [Rubrobacter sp.]|jgi:hypothetical protein|nr:hypothetical protein [Rubrobacter sp.]